MYISIAQTETIVEILKNYEGCLSDGYKFYCGSENEVNKVLEELAAEIIVSLNENL